MSATLAGLAFEAEIGSRFHALGWVVELTPVTGDYGADLVVNLAREKLVIQCKDYSSPVGLCAVQEVHLARSLHNATGAIVVARSGFTRAAWHGANNAGVILLQPHQIKHGCAWDRTQFKRQQTRRMEEESTRWARRLEEKNRRAEEEIQFARSYFRWRRRNWLALALAIFHQIPKCFIFMSKDEKDGLFFSPSHASGYSLAWRVYDAAMVELRSRCRRNPILRLGACLRLCGPTRPSKSRRGALITCDVCSQQLRVEFGRTGHILCPKCRVYSGAKT